MNINQDKLEQLIALLNGTLKENQKKSVLDEIQADPELSGYFDLLKQLHQVSPEGSISLISASKELSKNLFKDYLKEKSSTNKHFGIQTYDSSLLPLPEGVRPASVDTRLLKYQIGDAVVELTIYPITIDSVEIIGQINGFKENDKISIIAKVNRETQTADLDEFNLFRFARIRSGKCQLLIKSNNNHESIIELNL